MPRFLRHLLIAKNLRRLTVTTYYGDFEPGDAEYDPEDDPTAVRAFMTEFPLFLAHFKVLEFVTLELPTYNENRLRRNRIVHGMIRRITLRLQAHVTLLFHPDGDYDTGFESTDHPQGFELWIWEAGAGRVMDWSKVADLAILYTDALRAEYDHPVKEIDWNDVFDAGYHLVFVDDMFLLHDGDFDYAGDYFKYELDTEVGMRFRSNCVIRGHNEPSP